MADQGIDLAIIAVYLVGITLVGIWFSRHQRDSSSNYFLASRSLSWVTVGLALFATNISTVHLTGLAGAGYREGLVFGNFEWLAPFLLMLLGLVFAPFYFRNRVATLPEYLEGRYGPGSRTMLAVMAVIGAVFIHIGVSIYAGAEVMKHFIQIPAPDWWQPLVPYVDFNIAFSVAIVSLLTILYTALGGLKAVVVTESIQTILLLFGAAAVTWFGWARLAEQDVRSLSDLHRVCAQQQSRDAAERGTKLHEFEVRFAQLARLQDGGDMSTLQSELHRLAHELEVSPAGDLVRMTLAGPDIPSPTRDRLAQYLQHDSATPLEQQRLDLAGCAAGLQRAAAQQEQLQRELWANSQSDHPYSSKLSMIRTEGDYKWWMLLLGYPVIGLWYWCADQTIVQRVLGARSQYDAQVGPIFAGFIKVLPVFLMVLPGVFAYVLFRERIGGNADSTLSVLILELLPRGMRGIVLAGLLAALMSTVAGALNSVATLVSIDIVQRIWPGTSDRSLVRIGQVTAVVVMLAAMAWSTQGDRFGGIFEGINQMISVLAPPISTVFIWGIFWRRGTAAAALTTLMVGLALGLVVIVIDFPLFGMQLLTRHYGIPFMLQAWLLFVVCSAIYVGVSWMTPAPPAEQVERYCWASPLAVITQQRIEGLADPRILSLLLVAVIAVLYVVFA